MKNKIILLILFVAISYIMANQWIVSSKKASNIEEKKASNFVLSDLQGKKYSLSDYKGQGVIVNFWATYCPPCEREFPTLENVYEQYKNKGIEILAVNVEETLRVVSPFIEQKAITFPVILDRHGNIASAYEVINLPITFFINGEGEIVSKVSGEMTEEVIRENIEKLK